MSLFFVVARLPASEWARVPFDRRVALVREHYIRRAGWKGIVERSWHFPESGLGIHVAYQELPGKRFAHESRTGGRSDFLSHAPFGYAAVAPGCALDRVPATLARMADEDPAIMSQLGPPQTILTVDEAGQTFRLRNDPLGLGKSYLLQVPGGEVLASMPLAAHLMAMRKPRLSESGWASCTLQGWFMNGLTPYEDMRELLGGTALRLGRDGLEEQRSPHVVKWFLEPPPRSMFEGFDRFLGEMGEFVDFTELDVGLSGGRDSRASSAILLSRYSDHIKLRTNEPPLLEGIIARQLIERLPRFDRFVKRNGKEAGAAYDSADRLIWRLHTPEMREVDIFENADRWAYAAEGLNVPGALFSNAPRGPVFATMDNYMPTVLGVAGEAAKAYYWSPRMVSGAYARSLAAFREDIRAVKIGQRLQTHPLTVQSGLALVDPEFHAQIRMMVYDRQREAGQLGIHGYRFLDYWWFVERVGRAGTPMGSTSILPFMVPEFLAEAFQKPPVERARGQTLARIVEFYRPEWQDVPYFDEIQNQVPREQVVTDRSRPIIWQGETEKRFFEIIEHSPALGPPYGRAGIIDLFRTGADAAGKPPTNIQALGLVQRHAVWQLCEDIGRAVAGGDPGRPQ